MNNKSRGLAAVLLAVFSLILMRDLANDTDDDNFLMDDVENLMRDPLADIPKVMLSESRMSYVPPDRYTQRLLYHITTDKPVYKPGEYMFIELYLVDAFSKQPYTESTNWNLQNVKIMEYDSDNEVFTSTTSLKSESGTIVVVFKIPEDQNGGEYYIQVNSFRHPKSFRKFRINKFSAPELFVTTDFDKVNYSPGDHVVAKIKVRKPDGNALPTGSSIAYSVNMPIENSFNEGLTDILTKKNIVLDNQGETTIEIGIPSDLDQDVTVLTMSIQTYLGELQDDPRARPSVSSHSFMILKLDNFDVKFFPEFGDYIVPNVTNKVFFQAKSIPEDDEDDAEPIEFTRAELHLNKSGQTTVLLGNIKHLNNGRSYFSYTPSDDVKYESWFLKVYRGDKQVEVSKTFDLPLPSLVYTLSATIINNTSADIGVYKRDDMLQFRVQTNDKFNGLQRNVSVEIWMKDIYVMKYDLDLNHTGAAAKEFSFSLNDRVYSKLPNGGVMIMKLVDDTFWLPPVYARGEKEDERDPEREEQFLIPPPPPPKKAKVLGPVEDKKRPGKDKGKKFLMKEKVEPRKIGSHNRPNQIREPIEIEEPIEIDGGWRQPIKPVKPRRPIIEPEMPDLPESRFDYINMERLIFLKPLRTLDFDIQTDKETYQPGDQVDLSIALSQNLKPEVDETFYASVVVTDLSSFLKVSSHKLMPSLPSMVYLEKEVYTNKNMDEFQYSRNYIDAWFDKSTEKSTILKELPDMAHSNLHLDLLLATQSWRKKLLWKYKASWEIDSLDEKSEEKKLIEALLARDKQGRGVRMFKRGGRAERRFDEPMPMMMDAAIAFDAPMMMDAVAFDAGPMPAPMMMEDAADFADGPPMMEMAMVKELAVSPAPEAETEAVSDTDASSEKEIPFTDSFMGLIAENQRSYSHVLRKGYSKMKRVDFTQTLLFDSAKQMFMSKDENKVPNTYYYDKSFYLNDQVSQFLINVNLFSSKGKYGFATKTLTSKKLVYAKFTLPSNMLYGDLFSIPVTVYNNYQTEYTMQVRMTMYIDDKQASDEEYKVLVDPGSQKQVTFESFDTKRGFESKPNQPYKISLKVEVLTDADVVEDRLIKTTDVGFLGYEQTQQKSGFVGYDGGVTKGFDEVNWTFKVPATLENTPLIRCEMFTKSLEGIISALEALIRQPYGCFEQTASTVYPMVMSYQLMNEIEKKSGDSALKEKVQTLKKDIEGKVLAGYKKMQSYETSTKGFEWFGKAPGHEALSSYGVQIFQDMDKAGLKFVEKADIERTTKWLMEERASKENPGEFLMNPKALDTFGKASQAITDVYIVWSLSQIEGYTYERLEKEFKYLKDKAETETDPYFLSLVSGALWNVGRKKEARIYSKKVIQRQDPKTGEVKGSRSSITNSRGNNLIIETTSLATINWINQYPVDFLEEINKAVEWIQSNVKDGGRYGATQSTVLALRALVLYSEKMITLGGSGSVEVHFNDEVLTTVDYDENTMVGDQFNFTDIVNRKYNQLADKSEDVTLKLVIAKATENIKFSYVVDSTYMDSLPPSASDPPLALSITYDTPMDSLKKVKVGNQQTQTVEIENISGESQGMVVAILSVPACLSIEMQQLEQLKESNSIDAFEISSDNSKITLYWTYIKKDEVKKIFLTRTLLFTGSAKEFVCQQGPSQAYLYYDDNNRVYV